MKKVFLGLSLLSLFACGKSSANGIEKISSKQAKEMMDSQEVVILDVRTEMEFAEGHIKNAINVPLDEIQDYDGDKEKTILVYCRSGSRSNRAANILVKMGYKHIYDFGGIMNWGYEIVK